MKQKNEIFDFKPDGEIPSDLLGKMIMHKYSKVYLCEVNIVEEVVLNRTNRSVELTDGLNPPLVERKNHENI